MKIKLFNTVNEADFCVKLPASPVAEVNYHAVNFTTPTGKIRLKGAPDFTHFTTTDWVFVITGIEALGDDLVEYTYKVDWLKDYWRKYRGKNAPVIIGRTTNSGLIDPMITDELRSFKADTTRTIETGQHISSGHGAWEIYPWRVVVTVNMKGWGSVFSHEGTLNAIVMTVEQWIDFQSIIINDYDLQKAIVKVFIAPAPLLFPAFPTQIVDYTIVQSFDIYGGGTGADHTITQPDHYFYIVNEKSTCTFSTDLNFNDSIDSWLDINACTRTLYIPGVGDVPISAGTVGAVESCQLYFNLIDGTLSATINHLESTRTATTSLPEIAWVSSVLPQTYRNIAADVGGGIATTALGVGAAAIGAAAGIMTGGVATAIMAGVVGLAGTGIKAGIESAVAGYGAYSSASANGWDMIFRPYFQIQYTRLNPVIDTATQQALYGLPSGRVVNGLGDLPTGDHWLDFSNVPVFGNPVYAPEYRAVLHNRRIRI